MNSIWLSIRYIVLLFFALIIYKININQFGKELVGAWFLISSIWTFGNALDLGIGTSVVKFTAEYYFNKKHELKFLLASSFYLFFMLGICVTIIVYFTGSLLILNNNALFENIDITQIQGAYLILGFSFIVRYITIFFRSVLEGMNEFIVTSKIEIISTLTLFLFVCITSFFNLSISHLALFYVLVAIITLVFYYYTFHHRLQYNPLRLSFFKLTYLKKIFNFSLHIQLVTILGGAIDPVIKYLIGDYLGLKSVTYYVIGSRFATSISGLFATALKTILPKTSILQNENEKREFLLVDSKKYMQLGVFFVILAFGIAAVFIVWLIKSLYGDDEYIYIFLILSLAESVVVFSYTIYIFMMGIGKGQFLTLLQLLNLILISSAVFVGLYLFADMIGLIGYFIAVLICNFLLLYYVKINFEIPMRDFLTDVGIYKIVIFLSGLVVVLLLIYYYGSPIFITIGIFSLISLLLILSDLRLYILNSMPIISNYFSGFRK
ncbi:MAG: oligosaccharide flippase family protein [Ignavibacteria bacterium]|nr:oligosaccharide flippase family protein [Ignavibacteria bacterium]MDP3830861.1 oligosaccharide flippase family protein [Ignavibacteriaceae bacterium]